MPNAWLTCHAAPSIRQQRISLHWALSPWTRAVPWAAVSPCSSRQGSELVAVTDLSFVCTLLTVILFEEVRYCSAYLLCLHVACQANQVTALKKLLAFLGGALGD